ncbi:hypothetical protein GCM10027284_35340 [Cyclobacterium sediminis]
MFQSQENQAVLSFHHSGAMLKSQHSNEVADFEAISARNRLSIAYFGFNTTETIKSILGSKNKI